MARKQPIERNATHAPKTIHLWPTIDRILCFDMLSEDTD